MTFYRDINKFYNRKLIINSKYDLIVVIISFRVYKYFIKHWLEKFVLSYVFWTFSYNPVLLKFVNYTPVYRFYYILNSVYNCILYCK